MNIKLTDKHLRQSVTDELGFEPSVDATDIGVTAENGVVTLTGHVPSYAQKMAAEKACFRVKGVKAIAQEIQVRLPAERKDSDDEIARRALSVLAWNSFVPVGTIKIKVQNGFVTMSGAVPWNYQRTAAESSVKKLSGVTGLLNNIEIVPTTTKIKPMEVKQRIRDALTRHAEIEADSIDVAVFETGVVSLDGFVGNWDERLAVEMAAYSVPGIRFVEDRLMISE